MVRARFKVDSYETYLWHRQEMRTIKMSPVVSLECEENKQFFAGTPMGTLIMHTLNKKTWQQFELGKEYYIDFTPSLIMLHQEIKTMWRPENWINPYNSTQQEEYMAAEKGADSILTELRNNAEQGARDLLISEGYEDGKELGVWVFIPND